MSSSTHEPQKIGTKLSIQNIRPLDFDDPKTQSVWRSTLAHAQSTNLRGILEVRSTVQDVIVSTLRSKGFLHPPVHLFSTCVDPLNHETETARFDYYGQECTLMQSLIFHKMAILALSSLDKVFWISPNIRKELGVSDPRRYASEFTQIDFESTELDMQSCMSLIEEVVTRVYAVVSDVHGELVKAISGRALRPLERPMRRYDLRDEARRRGVPPGRVEALLAAEEDQPFFLTNLVREAYDRRDDASGRYHNYDVILPVTGEVLSGAEREHTHERLLLRMQELGYPIAYFEPILRLAKEHGLRPSAGAGFGVERFVRGLLLLDDVAEVYPFARVPEEMIIF